ncbi:hypothetical protein M2132_000161 [Dysgonomonas sp. PH5-45]|uniref:hypothetical protein n=1 Tax=unclassified Dysgonomonas TaxID=2630389 RepID=UPI002476B0F1|nr:MULTISPECIES: hypothetical protein [unclassified Dysgonomonas]MDH6353844.1 hypothetical protein [Dysgonomonas sp. PH5-45]MDH6386746.1 hypothetical protein [Dysgonomonas sp. PH5-37]
MRKIIIGLCVLFLVPCVSIYAQKKVATYEMSYFSDKKYDIEGLLDKDGMLSVYIGVEGKAKTTTVKFEEKELKELKNTLEQIKNKFSEWSKIAKENNVTDMTKEMDFSLPKSTICWYSSKWFFAFNQELKPTFMILEGNRHIVSIVKKVTASSNKYIDETIYWIFSSPQEIDAFINLIDIDKLKQELGKEKKTEELFQ